MNARPPISISSAPWFRPEFCAFMRSPVFLVERYLSRNLLPAVSSADHERRDVIGARKSHPILSGGQDAELPEKMPVSQKTRVWTILPFLISALLHPCVSA